MKAIGIFGYVQAREFNMHPRSSPFIGRRDAFAPEDWSVHRGAHFVLDHAGGENGMNGIQRAKFHQVFLRVLKQSSFGSKIWNDKIRR